MDEDDQQLTAYYLRSLIEESSSTKDHLEKELIRLANEHGVDLQSRDAGRETVLHHAVKHDLFLLVENLLEKGADVNAVDDNGETPLLTAAKNHEVREQLVLLLLRYGADATVRDIDSWNALHHLTRTQMSPEKQVRLAKALIEKGASINDREGLTQRQPIHVAVSHNRHELVKLFLDHGANVDSQAMYGDFPLYLAATKDSSPVLLKTLLEHGANVDMKTGRGWTALHAACEQPLVDSNRESIKLLLYAGADLFAKNNEGKTPLALIHRNLRGWIYWNGYPHEDMILMAKAVALKKFDLPESTELTDEGIIMEHPKIWDYYQDCIKYVSKAKSTAIVDNCTVYELLTKCHCQIAVLMRHRQFESEYKKLYSRNEFSMYTHDIREAFMRSEQYYHSILEQEDVINKAVYNILPHVVVRKVISYMFVCKMKKCASARK